MSQSRTEEEGQVMYMERDQQYLDYAEATAYTAKFAGVTKDFVDCSANGYIRGTNRDAMILSMGWVASIQADNDSGPAPALVIQILEISSTTTAVVPRTYTALEFVESPIELQNSTSPSVVFCYLEPGTPSDPPVLRKMKRTRIQIL